MGIDKELEIRLGRSGVWRGGKPHAAAINTIASGFDVLDRYLPGGGWPIDALTEIFIDRYGIGELSLLMPALSELSHRAVAKQQWIVWVSPPFVPYAPALSHHGIDLSCVLLVHSGKDRHDVLWATEQAIRSGSSAAVLAWPAHADLTSLRRLQLGIEEHKCWTVLFRPASAVGEASSASLRLGLSAAPAVIPLQTDVSRPKTRLMCSGLRARVDIIKCVGRHPETLWVDDVVLRGEPLHDGDYG